MFTSTFLKNVAFSLFLLLVSFFSSSAQTRFALASSSWIIHEIPSELGKAGNTWHFLSTNQLILENEEGAFSIPHSFSKENLRFLNQQFQIERKNTEELILNTESGAKIVLHSTPSLDAQKAAEFTKATSSKALGPAETNGVYYQFNDYAESYTYYRFYEDSSILEVELMMEPEEAVHYINQFYFGPAQDRIDFKQKHRKVELKSEVILFTHSQKTNNTNYQQHYTLSRIDKGLNLQYKSYSDQKLLFEKEVSYNFYASNQLGNWYPKEEGKEERENRFCVPKLPVSDLIFGPVGEMPRFPLRECEENNWDVKEKERCAQAGLLRFIYRYIKVPKKFRRNREISRGTVVVQFVIERDGQISNIRIVRDIGYNCGKEALKVIEKMQKADIRWIPGKLESGEPVRVQFNMPIKFKLE